MSKIPITEEETLVRTCRAIKYLRDDVARLPVQGVNDIIIQIDQISAVIEGLLKQIVWKQYRDEHKL